MNSVPASTTSSQSTSQPASVALSEAAAASGLGHDPCGRRRIRRQRRSARDADLDPRLLRRVGGQARQRGAQSIRCARVGNHQHAERRHRRQLCEVGVVQGRLGREQATARLPVVLAPVVEADRVRVVQRLHHIPGAAGAERSSGAAATRRVSRSPRYQPGARIPSRNASWPGLPTPGRSRPAWLNCWRETRKSTGAVPSIATGPRCSSLAYRARSATQGDAHAAQHRQLVAHLQQRRAPAHHRARFAEEIERAVGEEIDQVVAVQQQVPARESGGRRVGQQRAVRIDQPPPRGGEHRLRRARERIGKGGDAAVVQHVVVVQELDVLAGRQRDRARGAARLPQARGIARVVHREAGGGGERLDQGLDRAVARVVADHQFERAIRLPAHALQRLGRARWPCRPASPR